MGDDLTAIQGTPGGPAPLQLGTGDSVALIARVVGEHACMSTPDHFGHGGADLSVSKQGARALARWLTEWATEPVELWGLDGIAEKMKVSRPTVWHWRRIRDFPEPLPCIGGGPIWEAAAIRAWHKHHKRSSGRPKKRAPRHS